MYKIFINDKPFIITSQDTEDFQYAKCKRGKYQPDKILEYIKETESMRSRGMVLLSDDVDFAFKDFYTHYVVIEAAGGMVFNLKNELLLIKRMGKWDLPKGKIDTGETDEEAAVREVEEECGVKNLKIVKALPATYHTYKMHNHRFLKISRWFKMETNWSKKPVPQTEEQITEANWFDLKREQIDALDTYASVRDLLYDLI